MVSKLCTFVINDSLPLLQILVKVEILSKFLVIQFFIICSSLKLKFPPPLPEPESPLTPLGPWGPISPLSPLSPLSPFTVCIPLLPSPC